MSSKKTRIFAHKDGFSKRDVQIRKRREVVVKTSYAKIREKGGRNFFTYFCIKTKRLKKLFLLVIYKNFFLEESTHCFSQNYMNAFCLEILPRKPG